MGGRLGGRRAGQTIGSRDMPYMSRLCGDQTLVYEGEGDDLRYGFEGLKSVCEREEKEGDVSAWHGQIWRDCFRELEVLCRRK